MNRFVCDVWVSTQCSLDKMPCVCSQLPGAWELFVSPSLSDEAVSGEDEDEWAVMSLSLVLLSWSTSGLRLAAASRFCRSCLMRCFCCWLRGPLTRTRPFTCFSWQRFFLAAMATEDVSLSECERRDFLPAAWTGVGTSSADESVSESPRWPEEEGDRRQTEESLSSCAQDWAAAGGGSVSCGCPGGESLWSSFSKHGMESRLGAGCLSGLCEMISSSDVGELVDVVSCLRGMSCSSVVAPPSMGHSRSSLAFWASVISGGRGQGRSLWIGSWLALNRGSWPGKQELCVSIT